jgi:CRISPR system Cascade subunit CasD
MDTLLIRLIGPMQSWGVQSRFGIRDTGRDPSKSGVIGLLCAALGRPRSAPVHDLANLRMGVRVDCEGALAVDYHTAQDVYRASGSIKPTELSRRYFLENAAFLVGLEGPKSLLQSLHAALQNPHWMLFLGRKAFVPGAPVWLKDGLRCEETLETALQHYPLLASTQEEKLRLILEDPGGEQVRPDVPISFADRQFSNRRVRVGFMPTPQEMLEVI